MSVNLRMARINKQLHREIALILESRIKKESVKSAIITDVECARDLERAKVFFTALEARKCPSILRDLNEIRGVIRSLLGESIRLRKIPELEFFIDKSSEYGAKIDSILDRLGLIDHDARNKNEDNNDEFI